MARFCPNTIRLDRRTSRVILLVSPVFVLKPTARRRETIGRRHKRSIGSRRDRLIGQSSRARFCFARFASCCLVELDLLCVALLDRSIDRSLSVSPYAEVSVRVQLVEGHRRRGRRRPQARLRRGSQVRLRGLHRRHPLPRPREAVAAGGGDRAGGEGAGVRAPGGLRRRTVRARGLRGGALARPRRGARLQRLRATRRRRRRRLPAPDSLLCHLTRRLPPRPRRLRRRRLLLRPPSHTGDGRAGQGHRHLHRLVGVGHRLRRLLRSKLRQVRAERAVSVAGQGVPAGRRPHCSHDHRRRHRRTEVGEGEVRRRDDVDVGGGGGGPGRGGAELLARPRAGQERVDAGDGHPVAVADVVDSEEVEVWWSSAAAGGGGAAWWEGISTVAKEGKEKRFIVSSWCVRGCGPGIVSPFRVACLFALRARAAWRFARLILSVWCIHPSVRPSIGSSRCTGKLPPKATVQLSLASFPSRRRRRRPANIHVIFCTVFYKYIVCLVLCMVTCN